MASRPVEDAVRRCARRERTRRNGARTAEAGGLEVCATAWHSVGFDVRNSTNSLGLHLTPEDWPSWGRQRTRSVVGFWILTMPWTTLMVEVAPGPEPDATILELPVMLGAWAAACLCAKGTGGYGRGLDS